MAGARGPARPPAHVGRARAHRPRLPLPRRGADRRARRRCQELAVDLTTAHREIDSALRATTEALSQVTNLLAVASAPSLSTTVIRHVEVLVLQPQIVMVVVITASGAVAKRTVALESAVDPGLAEFAREYLNETLTGTAMGTSALRRHLEAPDLTLAGARFPGRPGARLQRRLRRGRPALRRRRLPPDERAAGAGSRRSGPAGRRCWRSAPSCWSCCARCSGRPRSPSASASSTPTPSCSRSTVIAASYGIARRPLGTSRSSAPRAWTTRRRSARVRGAAALLSAFVEDVYQS